ncbi:MAG: hypothetical protein GY809_15560 [Planctomycetes bacterium]|nr:hypothetical protein [Planctomycetota bacterium]
MLNEEEVAHLFSDGRELWLKVEGFGIAYHDRYRSKALLAKSLSYATVAAGVCTAVSAIPELQGYTMIPAVITAATAAISQSLSPEKAQRENWDTWKKIESLKMDLASRCRGLFLASNYAKEQTVFQNFKTHLTDLISSDISVTVQHKQLAETHCQAANIEPQRSITHDTQAHAEEPTEEQSATQDSNVTSITRRVVEI